MIVRNEPNGELILVAQTDHSRMVGQFGAHWGNERFATPRPYDSIVRAAVFHDFGWLRYETAPLYDAVTGETPEFRKVPMTDARLEEYDWCHDWLLGGDQYSSLIAGMHRTGLWRERYQTINHPRNYAPSKNLKADLEAFITKNEARQEQQRRTLDTKEVWTNYRLLQVWDLLGLYFGCQSPYEDYIEPCPVDYDDEKGVRINLKPVGPNKVAVDPYPFDIRPCVVQLSLKRLRQRTFPTQEAFHRAFFQAPAELREFELV